MFIVNEDNVRDVFKSSRNLKETLRFISLWLLPVVEINELHGVREILIYFWSYNVSQFKIRLGSIYTKSSFETII